MGERSGARVPRLDAPLEDRIRFAAALWLDGFKADQICAALGLTNQSLRVIVVMRGFPARQGPTRDLARDLATVRPMAHDVNRITSWALEQMLSPWTLEVLGELVIKGRGRAMRAREREPVPKVVPLRRCGTCARLYRGEECPQCRAS